MNLTPSQTKELHRVEALAGWEIALAVERWQTLCLHDDMRCRSSGSLGPLTPVSDETPKDFGQRFALGLRQLVKEI